METIDIDMNTFSPAGKDQIEKNISAEVDKAGLTLSDQATDFSKVNDNDFGSPEFSSPEDNTDLNIKVAEADTSGGILNTDRGTIDITGQNEYDTHGQVTTTNFMTKYQTPLLLAGAGLLAYFLFKK